MMPSEPRIIFMGTPEFAVASLDALVKAGMQVVAVVTAPDKPAGRGLQLTQSAVKRYAVEHQIPVLQPVKLKDPVFLDTLKSYQADLQIVVAFRMLPELVWNMPPMGTINLHGSLLPQYRGAAPINWAVINGEKETGVTTFKLQHEIDTGNILLQKKFPIGANSTAGEVHDIMKEMGANLLVETVQQLIKGTLTEQEQPKGIAAAELKHAPKLFTENCTIDWNQSTTTIYNLIRGLSPYPGALTQLDGKILKIYKATQVPSATPPTQQPGSIHTDGKTHFSFATTDGYISVEELQLEGKKKMQVQDFLRGYRM